MSTRNQPKIYEYQPESSIDKSGSGWVGESIAIGQVGVQYEWS